MPAIMTSGMVSRSNLPDRPRRRGGFGRGNSVAEGSSGTDKYIGLRWQRMIRQSVGGLATRSCANLIFLERDRTENRCPLFLIALCFRMRFAPQPVKLRIANVRRFPI